MQPRAWTRLDALAVAGASVLAAAAALAYLSADPSRPDAASLNVGWWRFSDQGRYLTAALAWAAGRLDPAEHWYLPGYPLLAAPFTRITPANPFLLPDLALLMAAVWLAGALAGWLAPDWRWARPAGAATALASTLPPDALAMWVTPWTSTPVAALTLGSLLAALHVMARPAAWGAAFWLGLCNGAIAAIRPADAVLLSLVTGLACTLSLRAAWPGGAAAARTAGAALGGGAIAILPALAAYVAVNGWRSNGYLILSAAIGFEWRLLPMRWVTIMLDPRPLFPDGRGLVAAFPWVAPGLAGMAACLAVPPGGSQRGPHALVAGAACAQIALYLCYRDLHPQGLWRFYNYHYFKWPLLVLALYSTLLLRQMLERRWAAVAAGMAALALLLPWRAELALQASPAIAAQTGAVLRLPPVTLGVGDAVAVPARGSFDAIYGGAPNLYVGANEEKWYSSTADFRVTPRPGGLLIAPLRPLRPGSVTVRFGPGVTLAGEAPSLARIRLVWGAPCWLPLPIAACTNHDPGPIHAPGETISLDDSTAPMLGPGWSAAEAAGRWTDGPVATLNMRVIPPEASALQVTAHGFAPPGAPPLTVTVTANGAEVARWVVTDGHEQTLRAPLPPGLLGQAGTLQVTLAIANPRSPHDTLPSNADERQLGLSVRAIEIDP